MENKDIIVLGQKQFVSSEYQKAIFTEIEQGVGNILITAAAGSAKTTTIENCLRFIPSTKKKLFLAFNVSTVEKLKSEVVADGVKIYTFHGLGNRILREHEIIKSDTLIDEFKYIRYIKQHIDELTEYGETESLQNLRHVYINNIINLVNVSRYYLSMTEREIAETAKIYDIAPLRDEFAVTRQVLIWGKDNLDSIDDTDMIWLPNVLNLETKRYRFDFIFIDEAQDTTIAHQKMVDKCFSRGARFVAVGDPKQQINVWCGATEKAIDEYRGRNNTKCMSLPISYRCPKKIVEMAREYSDEIIAKDDAIEGEIRYDVAPYEAKPGDMILCRVMSKLIELFLVLLQYNKKVYLKGNDAVKSTYIDLIKSTGAKYVDVNMTSSEGLIWKLYTSFLDLKYNYMEKFNIGEEDILYQPELINFYDNIEAIKVLCGGVDTTDELIDKINTIFVNDESDAIVLSTVHKAKGLEADNIFIYCPSLMPISFATKQWEIEGERNLIYVAITRAKKSLNYIKEDKKGLYYNFKNGSIKNEIDSIEKYIGYNKPKIDIKDIDFQPKVILSPFSSDKKNEEKPEINKKVKFKLAGIMK